MKSLYESLLTGKVPKPRAKVCPSSRKELKQIIDEHVENINPKPGQEVDLDWIDISLVDDLNELFEDTNYIPVIDTWKIDHVKRFNFMFAHNKYIVRSPLPRLQEKLSPECYSYMFWDCSSLKVAPELPAKTLALHCYNSMFAGCTALAEPPILPAKKPARACYWFMFEGCTSLKHAPELPATKLEPYCYRNMFENCNSLVYAPELPATELALNCYYAMFKGCRSLKVAPELPATELTEDCYEAMFQNCNNLRTKAKVPAGVNLNRSVAQDMYDGCPCENK